jgi:formylglycine-generating enzyme required for sulfatase activity
VGGGEGGGSHVLLVAVAAVLLGVAVFVMRDATAPKLITWSPEGVYAVGGPIEVALTFDESMESVTVAGKRLEVDGKTAKATLSFSDRREGLRGLNWLAKDKAGNEASGQLDINLLVRVLPAGWEADGTELGERGLPKKIRHGKAGITCVLIPSGQFQMGSPVGEGEDDERPRRLVTITKPFYMAVTETTQGQWESVMQSNPSEFRGVNRPVEMVSWDDAVGFCEKIGARLPTEAEWEYACRAGSEGSYCFGSGDSRLGSYAWYKANSGGETHDVAGKRPNEWGLYDMHGNVWEWCQDGYGNYPSHAQADPLVAGGAHRVFRGGSWFSDASYCRSAYRYWPVPGFRDFNLGFRVVLAPVLE